MRRLVLVLLGSLPFVGLGIQASPVGAAQVKVVVVGVTPAKGGVKLPGFGSEEVRFKLGAAATPGISYSCTVVIRHRDRVVARTGFTGALSQGPLSIAVPVRGSSFVGRPSNAKVACSPVAT
jgi:hypothetical protein